MKVALVHFRVGETDGVSLEMDKWKIVLEGMGHNVIYISGNNEAKDVFVIEEIAYNNLLDLQISDECYVKLKVYNCDSLRKIVINQAKIIRDKFIKIINSEKIECLIPNNVFSLGKSLPVAIGLLEAIEITGVYVLNHHHDFYWEREKYSKPTCNFVLEMLDKYFPPSRPNTKHVVINTQASFELRNRKNISSTVIPNVFDFSAPLWQKDNYNQDFKLAFNLTGNDIVFLQATRVTNRKSIEIAIQLISNLNTMIPTLIGKTLYDDRVVNSETEIVLLVVGLHEGLFNYEEKLKEYAKSLNVKLIMDPTKVSHSRFIRNNKKTYSLWDAYVFADIITYPSTYEGWGNQFLEGLFAKKPMVVFEYKVFKDDIAPRKFNYISLGNKYFTSDKGLNYVSNSVIEVATKETLKYLFDSSFRASTVKENYQIGKKFYSLNALKKILTRLFDNYSKN